jgi:hypothetical protein
LSRGDDIPEFDKFFSGQYHTTVYGFRLTLIGLVIGTHFSPIQFFFPQKRTRNSMWPRPCSLRRSAPWISSETRRGSRFPTFF